MTTFTKATYQGSVSQLFVNYTEAKVMCTLSKHKLCSQNSTNILCEIKNILTNVANSRDSLLKEIKSLRKLVKLQYFKMYVSTVCVQEMRLKADIDQQTASWKDTDDTKPSKWIQGPGNVNQDLQVTNDLQAV